MIHEEKMFGLGAGRLYIAPLTATEREATSLAHYAGPTAGGVSLAYSAKIHEITDYYGALLRSLRYGERVRITGRLTRLNAGVLARAIGARRERGALSFSSVPEEGRLSRVRVILVCPLPREAGGGEMRFSMIATAASSLMLTLSGGRDSSLEFSLTAESDDAGFTGRMVFS